MRRGTQLRFAAAALTLAWLPGAGAHDIPSDVTVQAFLKPLGGRLHLLVRVPLQAMRDVDFREDARGFLDLAYLDPLLPDAATLWISDFVQVYEGSVLLPNPQVTAACVSYQSDRSFTSFEEAWVHLAAPKLTGNTGVFWNQLMLDVAFEYPIHSDQSRFSIHPALDRLAARVTTVLRFLPPGGGVRAFEFQGDPGLVRLDPRWHQAAWRFVSLGFQHILSGGDHLLFLLAW